MQKSIRRGSKQKSAVLKTVKKLACHPTADDVFSCMRQQNSIVSLSTVYRNLGILVEEGDLVTIMGPGTEVHYDHNLCNHCHIQCKICGMVADLDFEPLDFRSLSVKQRSGFQVDGVSVTFTGVCSECVKKQEESIK